MATLAIDIPARVAEALDGFDGPLVADDVAFADVLRWNVELVADKLTELAQGSSNPGPDDLRRLARRIDVLADAYEAVG